MWPQETCCLRMLRRSSRPLRKNSRRQKSAPIKERTRLPSWKRCLGHCRSPSQECPRVAFGRTLAVHCLCLYFNLPQALNPPVSKKFFLYHCFLTAKQGSAIGHKVWKSSRGPITGNPRHENRSSSEFRLLLNICSALMRFLAQAVTTERTLPRGMSGMGCLQFHVRLS